MWCAGKGRMFKCLQESLAQPDFGQACRAQVEERGQRMQEDYRLDYGVAEACEPDVTTFCAAEKVPASLRRCTQAMHTMPDRCWCSECQPGLLQQHKLAAARARFASQQAEQAEAAGCGVQM